MVVADVCMLDFFRRIHGNHMEDSARSQRTKQAALTRERCTYELFELSYRRQGLTNSHCSFEPWLRTAKHQLASREKNGHSSRIYALKYLRLVKALPCPPTQNTTKQRCSASQRQRGPTTEAAAPPRIESARFSAPKKNGGYATRTPPHDDYRCRFMSSLPNGRHSNISS